MKICHIITRMVVGGAQENTLYSCRGQIEAGHQVVLLTGEETGEEGNLLTSQIEEGLKVVKIPSLKRNLSFLDDYRAYRYLKLFFKENHFDVVHTHSSKAGLLGRLAAYKSGIACVVHTIHGLPFHSYEKWYRNRLYILAERFAAKYCHKIFSVADAMTNQALQMGVGKPSLYRTIRSGMEVDIYKESHNMVLRHKLGIEDDCIVIGKVARLFDLKGHQELISIASQIVAKNKKVLFLIVGDGYLRSKLEENIRSRNLQQHFIFVGLVPPSEVASYMACMDILVHLSLREGLPRAIVQALASCRPVITYNLDGSPEVVKHYDTGLIYEPDDRDGLIEGLQQLISNSDLRKKLGKNGRELILKDFSWQVMVQNLQEEYNNLVKKP